VLLTQMTVVVHYSKAKQQALQLMVHQQTLATLTYKQVMQQTLVPAKKSRQPLQVF